MTTEAKLLLDQALKLSPIERAELINNLFQSFDTENQSPADKKWITEIESRIDAFEAGQMKGSSVEDVMERINNR